MTILQTAMRDVGSVVLTRRMKWSVQTTSATADSLKSPRRIKAASVSALPFFRFVSGSFYVCFHVLYIYFGFCKSSYFA